MKIASKIQSVKVSLGHGMKITVPAKLLGGFAIAAILMTAVALPLGTGEASKVNVASDLGGGITDFEEAYTGKVSLLQTQNEQANLFPEVEL